MSGYCYEITSRPDLYPLGLLNTEDCYASGLKQEHTEFTELDGEELQEALAAFCHQMEYLGCHVEETEIEDNKVYCFSITQEQKETYFRKRLEKLKDKVAHFSLEQFASDSSISFELFEMIDDKQGAAVMLDSCYETFDRFIRTAENGKQYWISKETVVKME